MTLAHQLAKYALAAADSPSHDCLRVRLLANIAAAAGRQSEAHLLERAFGPAHRPADVAFLLAAHMHARTQDDFYPPGRSHIGAVVVPAVLATGEGSPMPGLAAGYAVMCVISRAYAGLAQTRGWRPTGVFGGIGSAAGSAVAAGLDEDGIATAIGFAACSASGTNRSWIDGTDEWLIELATAARTGVEATQFAQAGLRSAPQALEGRAGWARTYLEDSDAGLLRDSLAEARPEVSEVAIKRYPISGIAQAPARAASQLKPTGKLTRIEVRMNPAELDYPGSRNSGPFVSRSDALMSIARCTTIALRYGRIPYDVLTGPVDAHDQELMDVVKLVPDSRLEETATRVTITDEVGTHSQTCSGADSLYPSWRELSADPAGLAERSEAPEAFVEQARDLISGDPDCTDLLSFLSRAV